MMKQTNNCNQCKSKNVNRYNLKWLSKPKLINVIKMPRIIKLCIKNSFTKPHYNIMIIIYIFIYFHTSCISLGITCLRFSTNLRHSLIYHNTEYQYCVIKKTGQSYTLLTESKVRNLVKWLKAKHVIEQGYVVLSRKKRI